jgi:hypothetical protein
MKCRNLVMRCCLHENFFGGSFCQKEQYARSFLVSNKHFQES